MKHWRFLASFGSTGQHLGRIRPKRSVGIRWVEFKVSWFLSLLTSIQSIHIFCHMVIDNAQQYIFKWILRLPSTTSTCACQLTFTAAGSCTVLGSQVLNAQNPRHRFMADSIDFSNFSMDGIYGSPQSSGSKFMQPLSFAIGYLKQDVGFAL